MFGLPLAFLVEGHISLIKNRIKNLPNRRETIARESATLPKSREDLMCIVAHETIARSC